MLSLSQDMTLQEYPKRGVILAKDSAVRGLGFLLAGRLQGVDFTIDGRSVGLYFVEPGDYFGELSVIDGQLPSEFVIAATQSVVTNLSLVRIQQLTAKYPQIPQQFLSRMALRVRNVLAQRTLLGLPNPVQRLCVLLLQLPVRKNAGVYLLDPVPTHQELAIMINTSRETVTRAFQIMTQQKIIVREGNQLKVLQLSSLKEIAEGNKEIPKTNS